MTKTKIEWADYSWNPVTTMIVPRVVGYARELKREA